MSCIGVLRLDRRRRHPRRSGRRPSEAELSFSFDAGGNWTWNWRSPTPAMRRLSTSQAALHTYLLVDNVRRARLGGLFGVQTYLDTVTGESQQQ
jgi:D-hexose-6-phosphate mutarotase